MAPDSMHGESWWLIILEDTGFGTVFDVSLVLLTFDVALLCFALLCFALLCFTLP